MQHLHLHLIKVVRRIALPRHEHGKHNGKGKGCDDHSERHIHVHVNVYDLQHHLRANEEQDDGQSLLQEIEPVNNTSEQVEHRTQPHHGKNVRGVDEEIIVCYGNGG